MENNTLYVYSMFLLLSKFTDISQIGTCSKVKKKKNTNIFGQILKGSEFVVYNNLLRCSLLKSPMILLLISFVLKQYTKGLIRAGPRMERITRPFRVSTVSNTPILVRIPKISNGK